MSNQILDRQSSQPDWNTMLPEFATQYNRIMSELMKSSANTDYSMFSLGIGTLFAKSMLGNVLDQAEFASTQAETFRKYAELSEYVWKKAQGDDIEPVAKPDPADKRFRSEQWSENLWYDVMKQSYLIGSEYMDRVFGAKGNLTAHEARKLDFYRGQWIDSLAPTNSALTNPDVLHEALNSGGRSIVQGLKNFADDLEAGRGVKMVERDAFELGRDIATTPGKVVARNRLAELIQYSPTTEDVRSVPVLIIPPWINKYYILDLSHQNSFVRWLVGEGYTVFMISWINPDETYRHTVYDNYLDQGPLWASKQIQSITGEKKINAIGYCLGGTLLATMLGYLANSRKQRNFINSSTFFASMIDFSEPGDLGVFVDENSVSELERKMNETGYLDGKSMASTFSMMRSNDLIWHFVVNNYLLGKDPGNFDLLYWNSDSTRLPADMHSEYLRKMYIENRLCKPNAMSVLNTPIDLSKVKTPAFFVSTQQDHIAPWRSTYMGARLFSGKVRFLLGESGHIAGIVNPPSKNKYGYWTSGKALPNSSDEWFDNTSHYAGSWWPEWEKWVRNFSGDKASARQLADALADAPGTYVKM